MILLGCVADDITGATDLAGAIVSSGLSASLIFGVPGPDFRLESDSQAVVIALKSRTAPPEEAIAQTLESLKWLQAQGSSQFFLKYCSTFDSTPQGNIGPVSDALMAKMSLSQAVHAPAYPANSRTVYMGHLFVGESLLSESGMRNHPLTPMRDSNIVRVLAAQTPASTGLLALSALKEGAQSVERELSQMRDGDVRHVIADTVEDANLDTLAEALSEDCLAAGGAAFGAALAAGLAAGLAEHNKNSTPSRIKAPIGGQAVLVGSASEASTRQVEAFAQNWPVYHLTAEQIKATSHDIEEIMAWATPRLEDGPILIAADTSEAGVKEASDKYGRESAAVHIEQTMGLLATTLTETKVRNLVVAGGETSGAVSHALALVNVNIGPEICPGVPWIYAPQHDLAVAFKSGNFGEDDFFLQAFGTLHNQNGN